MDDEKRKKMNEDIIKRLKAGDPLQDTSDKTWFPPRPVIQKDQDQVKKLYGNDIKIVGVNKLEVVKDDSKEASDGDRPRED